jgi:hypothetical protein
LAGGALCLILRGAVVRQRRSLAGAASPQRLWPRRAEGADRNHAVITHTATGQHLRDLEATFADAGFASTERELTEPIGGNEIAEVTFDSLSRLPLGS